MSSNQNTLVDRKRPLLYTHPPAHYQAPKNNHGCHWY